MDDTSQASESNWGGQQSAPGSTATRPDWLPEAHWDPQAGGIKPEFGAHFQELRQIKQAADERAAAIPATPEDYKIELMLPETIKVPEGLEIKLDATDPRVGIARAAAKELGLDQRQFSRLLAVDAEILIQSHTREMERVAAEDKKLGDNGPARKQAVSNWLKGLIDRKEISEDEYQELRTTAAFAAGVTVLEKLIAKSNGSVPGGGGTPPSPPKPSDIPIEQRWYGRSSR